MTEGDKVANDASDRLRRRNKSILEGTDEITRAASAKRASKVAPGIFHDPNVHYFGETVVIWDVREFLNVQKWREDAMRRSRNNSSRKDGRAVSAVGGGGGRKRKSGEGDTRHGSTAVAVVAGKEEWRNDDVGGEKNLSRKKRFRALCDRLHRKSLREG